MNLQALAGLDVAGPIVGEDKTVSGQAGSLEQQRLDAVGVDHVLARRPGEHGEAPVLRRDQRDRVALIVDELRGREMAGAAQLRSGCTVAGARPRSAR